MMQDPSSDDLQNNRRTVMAPNGIAAASNGNDLPQAPDLQSAERQCRRLARSHYENFLVASILVPRRHRQAMYNVYAFCRTADNLADESASPALATRSLDAFQQHLDDTFAGSPPPNIFLALADTIDQYGLSKQPFDDLLAAFQQDQEKNRYATRDELFDYCQCSADPVGRIVLEIAGCCDESRQSLSNKICTALQLVNFCQDVARDHQIGRIYFPTEDWNRHGVCESMFAESTTSEPLKHLIAEYCELAESMFTAGVPLSNEVPKWLAGDIKLFAHGGLATAQTIREIDFDVLRIRPTVGKWKQLKLLARAVLGKL